MKSMGVLCKNVSHMLSLGQMSTSGYSRSKITTFVFTSDLLKVGLYYLYISFWFYFFPLWFKQRYHCGIIWYQALCRRLEKSITTEITDFIYCCLTFNSMFFFIGNQHVISFLQLVLWCLTTRAVALLTLNSQILLTLCTSFIFFNSIFLLHRYITGEKWT